MVKRMFICIIPFILFCLVVALRSLCAPTAILRRCRRPYRAATALIRTAFPRRLFLIMHKVRGVTLCDLSAFTSNATALLAFQRRAG